MQITKLLFLSSISFLAFLTGCGFSPTADNTPAPGVKLQGVVHGGEQPIAGAHVYLFAAGTYPEVGGLSGSSTSLLNAADTGMSDATGAYVLTDANGNFSITNDYSCTPNTQVYLYSQGGNAGGGANSAATLMAVLGNCPQAGNFLATAPYITINEVSTVAAAYSMAGYAADALDVASANTTLGATGMANAFAQAANLVNLPSGVANTTTPNGNGAVPLAVINTVANILAACVSSSGPGSSACTTLFADTTSEGDGYTVIYPTETATAAIDIAHNPYANVGALFGLATANSPFAPALNTAPTSFIMPVSYTGGGLNGADAVQIDGLGNAWFANFSGSSVTALSPTGVPISPAGGFVGGGVSEPTALSIDLNNNIYTANYNTSTISEFNNQGAPLSAAGGIGGSYLAGPVALAVSADGFTWATNAGDELSRLFISNGVVQQGADFSGGGINGSYGLGLLVQYNVVVANYYGNDMSQFNDNGTALTPATGVMGGGLNGPTGVAIDYGQQAWITNFNGNSVSRFYSIPGPPYTNPSSSTASTGGGLNQPTGVAIDGQGFVWVSNSGNNSVTCLDKTGKALSPAAGYVGGGLTSPQAIAVDGSGNVWIANDSNNATVLIGAAIPVATPIVYGLRNNKLGSKP